MIARLFHRLVAYFCFADLERLQAMRRHTEMRIAQLETGLAPCPAKYRPAELAAERAHLRGIEYSLRKTRRTATSAAMRAMI